MSNINSSHSGLLSIEAEQEILLTFNKNLDKMYHAHKMSESSFELMTQKEVLEKFDLSPATLQDWESHGLKRYQPPMDGSRKVYYKKIELLAFLGAA